MAKNCCKYFTVSLVPVASLTLAVLFALGMVALPILYIHLAKEYRYGIVIDAGSSHTHMYAYRWDIPRYKDTGEIEQIFHCYSSNTLDSYITHPMWAGNLTQPCIDQSYDNEPIPKSQRKDTHMFLGATAGMRLVNRSNPSLSDAILHSINSSLTNTDYDLISGRIITGQEEAVSDWVTGNFLSHSLKSGSSLNIMGTLDMGGASTEITFLHSSNHQSDDPYQTTITLFDNAHDLYARSYLCYGLNQARLRLLAHLYNTTEDSSQPIPNPCLLKDALVTYNISDIFNSECVNTNSSDIFGFGYPLPLSGMYNNEQENRTVSFNGTGNPIECSEVVHDVFDLTNCSDPSVCYAGEYFWPPVNNSGIFIGMSGFYSVADFFNSSHQELHNLNVYNHTVHKFCQLTNNTASMKYNNLYLQQLCFNGVFSLFLLQTGFGFNSSNTNWTLIFENQVKGTSLGWAMGYLVNQTTFIPDDPHQVQRPFQSVDLVVGILVLSILCVVSVIFFFITFNACRKVLKNRGGYTNVP